MKLIHAVQAVVALLFVVTPSFCCPEGHDGHDHTHTKRASSPISPPTTPLVWGDFNVIHTTDSHGWLLGHQKTSAPEPNYSGDFGDFASFVKHMKDEAKRRDVDLLLIDSGDLHDGTGLSDGFPPGGVDAHESNKFVAELPYDVLAIGNHELYIYANTLDMYENFAPKWNGRYLSSNVNITVNDKHGNAVSVPVGSRFAKFKTAKGRSVTSVGVLYDFTGNDVNTTVQPVQDMVNEAWFAEAIAEEPDLFVLVGHMPVQRDDWPLVFDAVRKVHPTTPILIFGGHSHVRDCVQLDGRSMSLESGRYMETVGWMSANLDHVPSTANITFSRRYLDPNPVTYSFHTGLGGASFNTPQGLQITAGLQALARRFDLSQEFGVAPQDYFISRAPYPSNASLLSLFVDQVLPVALAINNSRASIPNIIISNSGEERFDLYAGTFTKNDQITVSPFTDSFQFLANVSFSVASRVLDELNGSGSSSKKRSEQAMENLYKRGDVSMRFRQWLQDQWERSTLERRAIENLTLGYVTHDACPGVGDDTPHTPLPSFSTPDYIGSPAPSVNDSTPIDLVFINFIQSDVLHVVNSLLSGSGSPSLTSADVGSYSNLLVDEVFGLYAQAKWN
ncbi:hypothetical protein K439DRAFT_1628820 [Ramaria rubella]|nr:hypothetical protein K439DRAFT_1628820 [Ramaria rubella]